MCGRITSSTEPRQLALWFDAELEDDVDPCDCTGYNVPPTSRVLVVVAGPHWSAGAAPERSAGAAAGRPTGAAPGRSLGWSRWGMGQGRPDASGVSRRQPGPGRAGPGLFNARAETVASKPAFRSAFASRRALVLADGFYEWERGPGGHRQPHLFRRADGGPMALAGVWEPGRVQVSQGGAVARSCAVVTAAANGDMDGVHDRMPVVLEEGTFDAWLDPGNGDLDELGGLVHPGPEGVLVHHPVSTRVGDVRNDDAALLDRVDPAVPGTLF